MAALEPRPERFPPCLNRFQLETDDTFSRDSTSLIQQLPKVAKECPVHWFSTVYVEMPFGGGSAQVFLFTDFSRGWRHAVQTPQHSLFTLRYQDKRRVTTALCKLDIFQIHWWCGDTSTRVCRFRQKVDFCCSKMTRLCCIIVVCPRFHIQAMAWLYLLLKSNSNMSEESHSVRNSKI